MSVGLGQDCVDGVEVELWGECYNIYYKNPAIHPSIVRDILQN